MAVMNCPKCGISHFGAIPETCLVCGGQLREGSGPGDSEANWPSWAKVVAARRRDGEAGVGDTFDRLAARVGGKAFKAALKKLGIPCGCDGRQRDWNALYPYQ